MHSNQRQKLYKIGPVEIGKLLRRHCKELFCRNPLKSLAWGAQPGPLAFNRNISQLARNFWLQ